MRLCCEPGIAARAPVPDIVIDTTGEGSVSWSVKGGRGRFCQRLSRIKILTSACVLVFLVQSYMGVSSTQRREERLAGLLEPVALCLADVVLEEHLEEGLFVLAQSLFCCPPLLRIEAVCQLD